MNFRFLNINPEKINEIKKGIVWIKYTIKKVIRWLKKKIVLSFAWNQKHSLEIKLIMFKGVTLSNCALLIEPYLQNVGTYIF